MTPARVGDGRASHPHESGPGDGQAGEAVLILDDHELVGTALAAALNEEGERARFRPVHSAGDVWAAVGAAPPGLLVLDLDLGRDEHGRRADSIPLIPDLRAAGWRILVLSGSSNPVRIGASLNAGAFTWVPKVSPMPTLITAVREARAGRSLLPPQQRRHLIGRYLDWERTQREIREKLATLTRREREVLDLLAAGKRAQAIAETFVVSLPTVRTQVRAVLGKLGVGSQLEAVAFVRALDGDGTTPSNEARGVR